MREDVKKLLRLIFNAVGLAMGVAVIVLIILDKIKEKEALYMLGIGLLCVSFSAIFRKDISENKKEKIKKTKKKKSLKK